MKQFCFIIILLLFTTCSNNIGRNETAGLTSILRLDRYEYPVGDTIKGEFIVKNISNFTVNLDFPNQHQSVYILFDKNGNVVQSMPHIALPAISHLTLHPGESVTYGVWMPLFYGYTWETPLPPGTYLLRAELAEYKYPCSKVFITIR